MNRGTEPGAAEAARGTSDRPIPALGIGPGDPAYLTTKARQYLARSDVIVGFESVIEHIETTTDADLLRCTYDDEAVQLDRFAERISAGANGTAVLMGDPNVSGYQFLEKIEAAVDRSVTVIPGVSSIQIAASHARTPLEGSTIVSLHKRGAVDEDLEWLTRAAGDRHLLVLPRPYDWMPVDIADRLIASGASGSLEAYVFERLTLDGEAVHRSTLAELAERAGSADPADTHFSDLSVLAVRSQQ